MPEDLFNAIMTETLLRLSLKKAVDEISSFKGPLFRNLLFAYLWLSRQYLFSYFFPRTATKRSSSQHQLMRHNSNCKVICRKAMVLAAKHFRGHISGSAASVTTIIRAKRTGNSQISHPCIALLIQNNVLGLYVSMDDSSRMQVAESQQHAD